MTKHTRSSRTRPGRNVPVGEVYKQSQPVSEGVKNLVRIPDLLWKIHPVQVWPGSHGNDREAKLDSGQIS